MKTPVSKVRERPSETVLGLWSAVVLVLEGSGVHLDPKVIVGVGTILTYVVTFFASRAEGWGP